MLLVVSIVMIVAGAVFFSSVIVLIFLSRSLFNHLEKAQSEYYAKIGSPKIPSSFELISFARQMSANKYLLSVIFGNTGKEIANDSKADGIIKSIRRIWFFANLPSWILWGAGILYLSMKYPHGMS